LNRKSVSPAPANIGAQAIVAESRIVHTGHAAAVLAHARALLTSTPAGRTAYLDADLRDTKTFSPMRRRRRRNVDDVERYRTQALTLGGHRLGVAGQILHAETPCLCDTCENCRTRRGSYSSLSQGPRCDVSDLDGWPDDGCHLDAR
jgi:hypothetical protein